MVETPSDPEDTILLFVNITTNQIKCKLIRSLEMELKSFVSRLKTKINLVTMTGLSSTQIRQKPNLMSASELGCIFLGSNPSIRIIKFIYPEGKRKSNRIDQSFVKCVEDQKTMLECYVMEMLCCRVCQYILFIYLKRFLSFLL